MMRLSHLGEFGFIAEIGRHLSRTDPEVVVGLGDDCAVLDLGGRQFVITTDAMLEGRHFRLDWLSPGEVGRRALTAALSDVAAMGARPRFAFTSLALPPTLEVQCARDLVGGLVAQAEGFGACLLGGDTIAAHEHVLIDVMLIGECLPGARPWRRDGAAPGEVVCVTGALGGAAAAVAARSAGLADVPTWEAYAAPRPRLEAAAAWAPLDLVSSALDVSDGLAQDARHLSERSRARLRLHAHLLPLWPGLAETAAALGTDPLGFALTGGEDFELLFTCPPAAVQALREAAEVPLTVIGEVLQGEGVEVVDAEGRAVAVTRAGWDHFGGDAGERERLTP